jgi:nicotinic acid phosphoribosyltransferase
MKKLTEQEVAFIKRIGVGLSSYDTVVFDEEDKIEEKVSEHLQIHGFDKNYVLTSDGELCESILDKLTV